jgi:hypothetical protein
MISATAAGPRALGLLILGGLLSSGCSTSTSPNGSGYFLHFQANGTTVAYTAQPSLLVAFGHAGTQYNALITGFDATSNMSVQVFDGAVIAKGTFSGYGVVGSAFVGALITYQDASGTVYVSTDQATDAIITITDLTATTMSGTFKGRLKVAGHPDIVVTNGEFFVKRAN